MPKRTTIANATKVPTQSNTYSRQGQHDDLGISCAMLAWAARHSHWALGSAARPPRAAGKPFMTIVRRAAVAFRGRRLRRQTRSARLKRDQQRIPTGRFPQTINNATQTTTSFRAPAANQY
jgi:hypothetical protein